MKGKDIFITHNFYFFEIIYYLFHEEGGSNSIADA